MTETEKRRVDLLKQTRNLYHDKGNVPAVHPRYGQAYKALYGSNRNTSSLSNENNSSFGIRVLLALLLFVLYAGADYQGFTLGSIDSTEIVEVISQDIEIGIQER